MLLIQKILFSNEECTKIINKYQKKDERFWKIKDRKYVSYLIEFDNETDWIFFRLKEFFEVTTNTKIINLKKQIHFHKFDVGDRFEKHNDNRIDRLYGIGVVLNEKYEGGDFKFYNENQTILINKKVGNCYIFDVNINHEVEMITNNVRYSLLWFLQKSNLNDLTIKSII